VAYKCPQCGKVSKIPDFCCGKMMVSEGNYACKSCGNSSSEPSECCGEPMVIM
jgi:transcription elongation factor Elf1